MQSTKKKRTYPSLAQKAKMISLLESDRDLQRGKFTSNFTKRDAERRWAVIANNLNSLPGARKAWSEWRKTWQDMKAAAKKKRMAHRELTEAEEVSLLAADTATLVENADALECVVEFEESEIELERTLISLVRQHKCLWQPADANYSNRRLKDALWSDVARQLPTLSGSPVSPEMAQRRWNALQDARAACRKPSEPGALAHKAYKHAALMSFLDDIEELSEQYIDTSALDDEPIQDDPLDNMCDQYSSPAENDDAKTFPPLSEKPRKKYINKQRILHQRTIKRFNRYGLDPNPQSEVNEDSDSAAEAILQQLRRAPEDGHTHFCLSLAPLMRSLPLPRVVGVRIKILQLLRDAMEIE